MVSELYAPVLRFDQLFAIRHLTQEILGRNIELHAFVDSTTVFCIVAKDSQHTTGDFKLTSAD